MPKYETYQRGSKRILLRVAGKVVTQIETEALTNKTARRKTGRVRTVVTCASTTKARAEYEKRRDAVLRRRFRLQP